ncbi:MAG: hypothetical protein IJS08_12840 [Victivallales bacterium]|nr:hypothetical protein [Victivallales bacterium]
MSREFICPLCFSKLPLDEVIKHCPSGDVEHNGQIHLSFLQKYFGTAIGELTCDACKDGKDEASKRRTLVDGIICPNCLQKAEGRPVSCLLPIDLVECDPSYIAVIGLRNSGKSHYIASLIQSMYEIASDIQWAFSCPDELTSKNYYISYKAPLYERLEALSSTRRYDSLDLGGKRPLIYTLEFKPPHKRRKFTCFFYDSAGEDLEESDVSLLRETLRYLQQASGVILLMDPMQLPGVCSSEAMDGYFRQYKIEKRRSACSTAELLRKIHQILPGKRGNGKSRVPVALAFSKVDPLRPLFGKDSSVFLNSSYEDKTVAHRVNMNNLSLIDEEMREWLREYQEEDDVLGVAEECFDNLACFGVSALGNGVLSSSNLGHLDSSPNPYNCVDPLLWILWQNGFLKGK